MPVTIDITKDIRYKQGREVGAEEALTATAEKLFINGLDISLVQNVTGLERNLLEEIAKKIATVKR